MTREEILNAIANDKTMPFIQPEQLAGIVDFVIKNYVPSVPGLDEAAEEYARPCGFAVGTIREGTTLPPNTDKLYAFKAGAEWMAGQFEKNRLSACDVQTDDEYERETAFVDKIIREKHRTPTFSDAINFGIECERAKMMGKAEVELEKEMDKLVTLEYVNQPDDEWEMCIARHFYELGLNTRKEE